MSLPRGKSIPLSPLRRFIGDLLQASRNVPMVAIERRMQLREVVAARHALRERPSWFALLMKAFALVCDEHIELRRSYLSFPWARLHQHACNVASVAVARQVDGEEGVLASQIRYPESMTLREIDQAIHRMRTKPVEEIADFRRILRISRYPRMLRRLVWWAGFAVSGDWKARYGGTFGITGVSALGSASLHTLSPLTTTLTTGVFDADGSVNVRMFYDHRVFDGVLPALALEKLEAKLHGPILEELKGYAPSHGLRLAA